MLIQGILYSKEGKYGKAEEFFEKAAKLNKTKMEPHFY